MRILKATNAMSAMASIVLIAGCAGGSAISPAPVSAQRGDHLVTGRVPNFLDINNRTDGHIAGYDSCPAKGPIKYVSDADRNEIYIYKGVLAKGTRCGVIESNVLHYPLYIYVKASTHDLYVANDLGFDVLVFHRGQTTPYNTYTDPTGQQTRDIAVANDGTVIAANYVRSDGHLVGSISTWIGGPNGGTFVGNYPMSAEGVALVVKKNGTIYFNQVNQAGQATLWSLTCPSGVCGTPTQIAGVSFADGAGLALDDTGDLLAVDQNSVEIFELPNPNPMTMPLQTADADGIAINSANHHVIITDPVSNHTQEYAYPDGTLLGTVPGARNGATVGVAVDP